MGELYKYKPDIIWEARTANASRGSAGQRVCTLTDLDAVAAEPFTVFDPVVGVFREITQGGGADSLGQVGDFCDGKFESYWNDNEDADKGLSTSSVGDGAIATNAISADYIIDSTKVTTTLEVTTGTTDALVEGSEVRSSSFTRCWSVLIRRADGADITGDGIIPYVTTVSNDLGSRVDNGQAFFEKVPNRTDGWYWAWTYVPAGAVTTVYFGVSLPAGGTEYWIEAPMQAGYYTGFANIPRCPVLNTGTGSNARGQYQVTTAQDTGVAYPAPVSGYIAMGLSLPYSSAYTDESGSAVLPAATFLEWTSGTNFIRLGMSSTNGIVGFVFDGVDYPVYLDNLAVWDSFDPMGLVMRWEELDGNFVAELYLNGIKQDDAYLSSSIPLQQETTGALAIGCRNDGSNAADAWIPIVVSGRQRITQDAARELSLELQRRVIVQGS